ncbi:MAG: hypothetical protein Q8K65_10430 [Alphaproteobacteria bacterium]|nr:hypothetical protein [Alphaproteobacteria bacterium]
MPKRVLAVLFFIMVVPVPAAASNWLECEGRASVTSAVRAEDGVWQLSATASEAIITDGFGEIGTDCTEAKGDVTIASDQEIAAGEAVRFKYSYYGGLGPQGPVISRTWTRIE